MRFPGIPGIKDLRLAAICLALTQVSHASPRSLPNPRPKPLSNTSVKAQAPETEEEAELPPTTDEPRENPTAVLGLGEQRLFRIPGLLKYAIGGEHLRALPLPAPLKGASDALLIKGSQVGIGDLWVWKSDGSTEHRLIRVEKSIPPEVKPGLEVAISRLREVEVLPSGAAVLLRGTVRTLTEATRIEALLRGFGQEVKDETRLSSSLLQSASESLERWLAASRFRSQLRLERQGGQIFLNGSVERAADQELIRREARGLFPLVRMELDSLPDDSPTVHFKVFLLELKRSRRGSLGIGWPAFQEGAFRVTSMGIEDLLQLDLTLQMLEEEGGARVLSNPELVVRAPGEAELFSGGELPIQNRSSYYASTTWKNFGLLLKLKATHSTATRVRLEILTEVSSLDPTLTLDKTPGIQANRMRTQVDARYGQPLLLSGLLQQGTRQHARGLPMLRRIPILGSLFGSEDYLSEKSELVAILLPTTLPPPPPRVPSLPPPADRFFETAPENALQEDL